MQNSHNSHYPALAKIPLNNFWIWIGIENSTVIDWFVANETYYTSKDFIRIHRQLLTLSAKFVKLLSSGMEKNSI